MQGEDTLRFEPMINGKRIAVVMSALNAEMNLEETMEPQI